MNLPSTDTINRDILSAKRYGWNELRYELGSSTRHSASMAMHSCKLSGEFGNEVDLAGVLAFRIHRANMVKAATGPRAHEHLMAIGELDAFHHIIEMLCVVEPAHEWTRLFMKRMTDYTSNPPAIARLSLLVGFGLMDLDKAERLADQIRATR